MSEAFIGEIRIMGFNFPPYGWAACNGAIMNISQNQALYALLGTMYGGDGRSTFALPDLQGRCANHVSSSYPQGTRYGSESVTLTVANLDGHTHPMMASTENSDRAFPTDKLFGVTTGNFYAAPSATPVGYLNPNTVSLTGGSAPHDNMAPSLVVNYCIAVMGYFPPRD